MDETEKGKALRKRATNKDYRKGWDRVFIRPNRAVRLSRTYSESELVAHANRLCFIDQAFENTEDALAYMKARLEWDEEKQLWRLK